ncbi:GRAM domain-containing protein 2B isoform X1 [Tachyglossus aculeatus]|uniref:GRAM domain-containing protein 2B isoform X1 n=1 Tax=Tachyglossus aculeatus TaxID=9261 RepID=UPI0018F586EC|nr:GRAM domain-containing protein 2B isoform X1 [Tachyglossus aculeatus]
MRSKHSSSDTVFHFDIQPSQQESKNGSTFSPIKSVNSVFLSSESENGVEEKKKAGKSPTTQPPTPSSEADSLEQKKNNAPSWMKTSIEGPSLTGEKYDSKMDSKTDSKPDRKKSFSTSQFKANVHFHKLFLEVSKEEPLRQSFTCALQKEILFQGKLFISENWICFHSFFGKDTKICIPAPSVTLIKKTKTALLVPNALIIATVTDKYVFVSLLSRDTTYKLLKSVCRHLENTSVGNSPNPSSAENSFRADRPTSLPLDFNEEFSDLDGVVQQRRQEMEEFSSSGSQTPESENFQDFHMTEAQAVLKVLKREVKPIRADKSQGPEGKPQTFSRQAANFGTYGFFYKSQKYLSLRHILIFYAVIVCALIVSTFYMRYKINALEERLGSLASFLESHNAGRKMSGVGSQVLTNPDFVCEELTANIIKLEKIQNNLQKLLENDN